MLNQVLNPVSYKFLPMFAPYFGAGLIILILGLTVLAQERISKISVGFFLLTASISVWCVSIAFIMISSNDSVAFWWVKRAEHLGVCFIPSTAWFFTVSILNWYGKFRWSVMAGFLYSAACYLVFVLTNWFVRDSMYVYPWGRYPSYILPNFLIFLAYFAVIAVFSPFVFLSAYKSARKNVARLRYKWLCIAFSFAYLASVDFIPAFGVNIYPVGFLAITVLIFTTAYAFKIYRFIDITPAAAVDQIVWTMNDMLIVVDMKWNVCFINRAVSDLLGFKYEEAVGAPVISLIQASPGEREKLMRWLQVGLVQDQEINLKTKGGQDICGSLSISPLTSKYQDQEGLVMILRDIRERRQAEIALQESKQRLADIINFLPDATFATDMEGRVIAWNKAMEALAGVKSEDMLGQGDREYSQALFGRREPMLIDLIRDPRLRTGKEHENVRRDRDIVTAEIVCKVAGADHFLSARAAPLRDATGKVTGCIEVMRDIADRRRAEEKIAAAYQELKAAQEQLVRSEKMAAVGQLAAGVAHEINNPLGVVLGFAQSLLRRLPPESSMGFPLQSIEREAVRCKNLVKELLAFSRNSATEKIRCDLNAVVQDMLHLAQAQARVHAIEVACDFQKDLLHLSCNPLKLQQVLINLCNNAIDAMPNGGRLTIRTLQTDQHLEIQVGDTGRGIPPEIQSKIFEPFFTTKEVGKGTGLGLSLVYEIVRDHGGRIEYESEAGKGTLFRVIFPLSPGG